MPLRSLKLRLQTSGAEEDLARQAQIPQFFGGNICEDSWLRRREIVNYLTSSHFQTFKKVVEKNNTFFSLVDFNHREMGFMSSLVKTAHVLFVKNLRCFYLHLRCMSPTDSFPVDSTLDLREEKKKDRQQRALQVRKCFRQRKKVGKWVREVPYLERTSRFRLLKTCSSSQLLVLSLLMFVVFWTRF